MKYLVVDNDVSGSNEPLVRIFLRSEGGEVHLMADHNDDFDPSYLLTLTPSGHIQRHSMVDEALGFELDDDGQVELINE